jgi:hypothetical protein
MVGRRPGLASAVVLAASLLCLAAGVLGCGSREWPFITTTTSPAVVTDATVPPPLTATTLGTTTTLAPMTTTEGATTTTESPTASAERRFIAYQELMQAVKASDKDMTAEIAGFLAPKAQAQTNAPSYQEGARAPADSWLIVKEETLDTVVRSTLSDDGLRAKLVELETLSCRDGLTTRGIVVSNMEKEGGEWLMSTVAPDPFALIDGDSPRMGDAVKVDGLVWQPNVLYELKHLGVDGGPEAEGMFLEVGFRIVNQGQSNATPALWKVDAVGADGTVYPDFVPGEQYVYGLTGENRSNAYEPGSTHWLWSVYAVPEGTDMVGLSFKISGPLKD